MTGMKTYNLQEVSEILGVSTRTARRYIKADILPMIKLNGRTSHHKISEARFQKWFDEVWDTEIIVNTLF